MAARKKAGTTSFDSIIEAERLNRKKKENQTLANQLLGSKSRRASAPGSAIGSKKAPAEKSLASRIGVAKRSASTSAKPKFNTIASTRATTSTNKRSTPSNATSRRTREDRMLEDIVGEKDVNVKSAAARNSEISIRGVGSGPFVVIGRNFAPGTNAADIEAALEPVAGHIVGVHITSSTPYVNAQIACAEKWGAEAIVAQFHGQKADGRVLSLEYKGGGTSYFNPPTGPRSASNNYDTFREQADRERVEHRKAEPRGVQDGRQEFSDSRGGRNSNSNRRVNVNGRSNGANNRNQNNTNGLYSDKMMVDAPVEPIAQRGRGFR